VRRIDVEEDDVFRRHPGEDRVAEDLPVTVPVEAGQEVGEIAFLGRHVREGAGLEDLERVERRESLELDQLRLEPPVLPAHDGEVRAGEDRTLPRARHVERRRTGGDRSSASGA
jgi:hypothetical protein